MLSASERSMGKQNKFYGIKKLNRGIWSRTEVVFFYVCSSTIGLAFHGDAHKALVGIFLSDFDLLHAQNI